MQLKHWGARLALGALLFAGVLACRTADVFVAQATTVPTRTPRATFTPLPLATDTPQPTAPSSPTPKPTLRPTARPATRPPPTAVPKPVAQPTSPPAPQFRYKSANKGCEHSGQTFIQGTIYSGSSPVNGVTVVMSGAPDGGFADKKESGADGDGFYSMIVEAGGAAQGQKRWVWVVEGDKRVSDIVQFDFNNLPETNPATCWRGFVDFVQQY